MKFSRSIKSKGMNKLLYPQDIKKPVLICPWL